MRFWIVGAAEEYRTVVPAVAGCRIVGESPTWPGPAVSRGACDAVIVAQPLGLRARMVRQALLADLPVLAEAPLAEGQDEARALCELAESRRSRLAVSLPHRFDPPIARTLAFLRDGGIGPIVGLRAEVGSAHDHLVALDLARLFLGEIVACQAQETFALLRNGDRVAAEVRRVEEGQAPVIDVLGQGGYLRVALGPWVVSGKLANGRRVRIVHRVALWREVWSRVWSGCAGGLKRELEAFIAPRSASSLLATGWDACRLGEMLAGLEQSRWMEAEVPLRPLPVTPPSAARREALVRGAPE